MGRISGTGIIRNASSPACSLKALAVLPALWGASAYPGGYAGAGRGGGSGCGRGIKSEGS
ncbi:hypothetical protein ACKS0A_10092 [Histoplasma ohiense]